MERLRGLIIGRVYTGDRIKRSGLAPVLDSSGRQKRIGNSDVYRKYDMIAFLEPYGGDSFILRALYEAEDDEQSQ